MKKPSLIKRFFSFLLRLCVVLVLMAAIAVGSFEGVTYYLTGSFTSVKKAVEEETDQNGNADNATDTTKVDNKNMENTLVFVHDDNTDRDYTALRMYDKETQALDILLMPCDAQVSISKSMLRELRETMPDAATTIRMDEVARAFGEKKYEAFVKIIEDIGGISISGYDVMSQQNFKKLLNIVDGVDYHFDNAISYRDTDNVLQTIDAGDIELDSEKAYALCTYMDGTDDEESRRLERASTYLTSYMEKLLSDGNSASVAKKYDNLVTREKKEDVTSTEDILKSLATDAVTIRIMQGSETKGVFSLDSQKVKLQISALAKQAEAYKSQGGSSSKSTLGSTSSESGNTESSKECSIEIYNAAYVSGLAKQWESYLEGEGYRISLVDSYQEEGPISQTRINVTKEGMGEDLLQYFPDAEVNVVDSISTGGDIQIFVGTDSTSVPESSNSTTTESDEDVDDEGEDEASSDSSNSDSEDSSGYDFSEGQ